MIIEWKNRKFQSKTIEAVIMATEIILIGKQLKEEKETL